MTEPRRNNKKERRYPGLYEKGIPIILAVIIVGIIILIVIAIAVIFNLF